MGNQKEKWYLATGRETNDIKRNATKVLFYSGEIRDNIGWAWNSEEDRTYHRLNPCTDVNGSLVAYTFGRML